MNHERPWRSPTIAEIAKVAGVGTATVDRVLNGRDNVREATRAEVMGALSSLNRGTPATTGLAGSTVVFLTDSGTSFNASLEQAVVRYGARNPAVQVRFESVQTAKFDASHFARTIEKAAEEASGLVVVIREDLAINRALRAVSRRMPVVCLTTDLPASGRTAYVGNDQSSAGAIAAYLMGRLVGERAGKVLIVFSAPYRVQEEREVGFRRVLRSDFTHLEVDDRLNSNDDADFTFRTVMQYLDAHGAPLGIYNVAGGNLGIGRALEASGLIGQTVFIGHELNTNSRMLLETGLMDIVIGHDVDHEVMLAVKAIEAALDGASLPIGSTEIKVHTKFNCIW